MIPGSELFNQQNQKHFRTIHRHFFHRSAAARAGAKLGLFLFYCVTVGGLAFGTGALNLFYDSLYVVEIFTAIGILLRM
jgi:hypothetical protein